MSLFRERKQLLRGRGLRCFAAEENSPSVIFTLEVRTQCATIVLVLSYDVQSSIYEHT
jgi:hypothetical protein